MTRPFRLYGFIGLGDRLQVRPNMYLLGEVSPRLGGHVASQPEYSFALEGCVGGFSNSLFLGFNLARSFITEDT